MQIGYFDAENLSLKFHQILSKLTLRQRNVFNMKYFDELKFSEISKITGININTIKSTYYLVEKKIKKEINESAL
jgi:RNA polymerase sigma-70 factor (ECF subfamily)